MEPRVIRFKDILALRRESDVVAFHTTNMQVASLDHHAWDALVHYSNTRGLAVGDDLAIPEHLQEPLSEIIQWNREVDPAARDQLTEPYFSSFVFNVVQYCNLHCVYCAAGGDGTYGQKGKIDLTKAKEQVAFFLKKVPRGENFSVNFFGGEPLLHPEAIRELAQHSRAAGNDLGVNVGFTIITNGTLLNDNNVMLLAEYGFNVVVSLDGPAEINDTIRPSAGGKPMTAQVIAGIRRLRARRENLKSISMNSVFGPHNMDIEAAWRLFMDLDLDGFNPIYADDQGNKETDDAFVKELSRVADLAVAMGGESAVRKISTFRIIFDLLDNQSRRINHCGAGKNMIQSDVKGRLFTCAWLMNEPSESVGQDTEIWTDKLADYADPLIEKHGCNGCWARFLCGGGCMYSNKVKNGTKNQRDNSFCNRTRALSLKGLELYAQARNSEGGTSETY